MNHQNSNVDISNELKIYRTGNGISLIRPEQARKEIVFGVDTNICVADLFKLPLSVYFLNCESQLVNANPVNLENLEVDSLKQVLGKTVYDFSKNFCSQLIMENNKKVVRQNKKFIFEEDTLVKDDLYSGVAVKLPWYNKSHEIIGILGLTIVKKMNNFANALTILQDLGFLGMQNNFHFQDELKIDNIMFTKREVCIIKNMLRGCPARIIGNKLHISSRTVETHINNIKTKLGVRYKSEIIQKVLDEKIFSSEILTTLN